MLGRGSASADDADADMDGVSRIDELNERIVTQQQKIQQRKGHTSAAIAASPTSPRVTLNQISWLVCSPNVSHHHWHGQIRHVSSAVRMHFLWATQHSRRSAVADFCLCLFAQALAITGSCACERWPLHRCVVRCDESTNHYILTRSRGLRVSVDSPSASSKSDSPSLISGLNDISQAMLFLGTEVEAASSLAGPCLFSWHLKGLH